MNKYQKLVQKQFLNDEETVIKRLKSIYNQSYKDINKNIVNLNSSISALQKALADIGEDGIGDIAAAYFKSNPHITPEEAKETLQSAIQSKVYQKNYQKALQKQVDGILDNMYHGQYKTISDYLELCYENGFIGTMYDLQGQGIPLCFPLDQEAMVRAVQLDSKISKGLYQKLGEDVAVLKKKITAQVSRGIATGMTYDQVALQLSGTTNIGFNNAVRIARTEGHRIQCQSGMDACYKAKDKGADVVKQWDATLDSKTRESHTKVDGEIRELDETFSNGLRYPGDPSGGAAEVVNCRCALLQRARWALDEAELKVLQDRASFYGLDKTANFEDFKAKYLKAAEAIPEVKPKKEYLTEKKLQSNIAEIEKKQKLLIEGSDEWQQLEDLKTDYQEKLNTKLVAKQTKQLKKDQILLQDQLDAFDTDEKFGGIWYGQDDITVKDWKDKQSSIQKKVDWYEDHIKNASVYGHSQDDIDKFNDLLAKTKDFDKKGQEYWAVKDKLTKTNTDLTKLQNNGIMSKNSGDVFSQDHKDAAYWFTDKNGSTKAADGVLRDKAGEVWQNATSDERYAIYDYTCGSGKFNRPLSGFEKPYNEYGSGWEAKYNKGVKNVWIDYEGAGDEIRRTTDIISRSTYDFDMWLQRGCGGSAMDSFFGLPPDTFARMSNADLQNLVGQSNRIYSFVSTSVSKGKGFSGDCIMNIYAPKGTQMMYCEPFSRFGSGSGLNWDGISKQSSFGYESEMLVQRGAYYKVTKIEKSGGTVYVDMEIHPEQGYDLFQQDPSEWTGSKKKGR